MPRKPKVSAETPPADITAVSAAAKPTAFDQLPAHSPQGGSVAEQFIACPGSKAIRKALLAMQAKGEIELEPDDPEYRRAGILAHEMASAALQSDADAWELLAGFPSFDAKDANNVQEYLSYVRQRMADPFPGIEIVDLKFGEGIVVEPEENAQTKYYAFGHLEGKTIPQRILDNNYGVFVEKRVHLPEFHPDFFGTVDAAVVLLPQAGQTGDYHDDIPVRLTIVQPRVPWHPRGIIRSWDTTAGAIRKWAHETLLPAMNNESLEFNIGPHCRFCPAVIRGCPKMKIAVDETAVAIEPGEMSQEQLAHYWSLIPAVRKFHQALDERIYRLFSEGKAGPELQAVCKLVYKITYRAWKDGAEQAIVGKLGDKAWTAPKLISPSEAEKLSSVGKALVAEYAFTPPANGTTLAPIDDTRRAIEVKTIEQKFPVAAAETMW